jgi:hypothetical protein
MKIEIKRFMVTVHGETALHDKYSVAVESPHPDEAMAILRFDHKLPTGAQLTAKPIRSKFVETEVGPESYNS